MIGRRYHGDMFLLGYRQLEGGGGMEKAASVVRTRVDE